MLSGIKILSVYGSSICIKLKERQGNCNVILLKNKKLFKEWISLNQR
jgi:hypothetical protein